MGNELEKAIIALSPIQKTAVDWMEGSALVLAGPGAGKTRVLTTRIAKLLFDSPSRKFRILALTFTTKAANEMRERVQSLVPGLAEERTFIGTFHAFCTQILRQHGSHIGISPDFGIFGQKEDQEALLLDAILDAFRTNKNFSRDDVFLLSSIKDLKSQLVTPEKTLSRTRKPHLVEVYKLYEEKLRSENVMDYEGLILEACRLLSSVPAIAARIRQSYPYWLLDEFQDTTPAQYWFLYYLRGGEFNNVFAVADDDQIIYQWAGASYRQIEKFRKEYNPELIQLVENHRCPPEIVSIANLLVSTNTERTPEKKPTIPGRTGPKNAVSFNSYESDEFEREAVASQIFSAGKETWGETVILGRTRSLLSPMLECLRSKGVNAVLSQRRDNFISPQFVWLQALLDLLIRPTNKRVFTVFVNSANRICEFELDPKFIMAQAESSGIIFCEEWIKVAEVLESSISKKLVPLVTKILNSRDSWKRVTQELIPILLSSSRVDEGLISDADEDNIVWDMLFKEIRSEVGHDPALSEVIQGIALRSKEPPTSDHTVLLMTIHASKGLEFENVYIIGLAEEELPSWQSCSKGDNSQEMEEERRNCFVAITRTIEKLNLSNAKTYRGRSRNPSRFLSEMSIV